MQPPPPASGPADNSSTTALPGFQRASELARPAHTPPTASGGSMRNASGGLPPIPKAIPRPGSVDDTSGNGSAGDSSEQSKEPGQLGSLGAGEPPAKPVNRPAASKNAIVYSAVQVSPSVRDDLRHQSPLTIPLPLTPASSPVAPKSSASRYQERLDGSGRYRCGLPSGNAQRRSFPEVSGIGALTTYTDLGVTSPRALLSLFQLLNLTTSASSTTASTRSIFTSESRRCGTCTMSGS
jgi:hypothetical protein